MSDRMVDPAYLRYQYGDSEKLRIRIETHERYSERPSNYQEWVIGRLAPQPGQVVLDVGCGPGSFHRLLSQHDLHIIGCDLSLGMVQEARQQARQHHLPVLALQANAEAVPLHDGSCDRVMASHVLFLVPDQVQALREMRRVLRPGGRVITTTNAADHGRRLYDIHAEVARSLGYTPSDPGVTRFSLDDLSLVRSVFPTAERHLFPNAFVFPTAEAALRYYASGWIDGIREWSEDGSHRARLLPLVEQRIEAIIEREGVFRVPKDTGCFVADI